MANETNIYIKPISEGKYEILSRNLNIEQGSYSIQNVDGLWIMKKNSQNQYLPKTDSKDFFVFDDEQQASKFAYSIKNDIEQEKIKGIKAFNNKFYFFKVEYYIDISKKILSIIDNGTSITTISEKTNVSEEVLLGIIEIMKEDGLVFEKTKDKFYKI